MFIHRTALETRSVVAELRPLRRQASQLVDLAGLSGRLVFAGRAKTKFAGKEPSSPPGGADYAGSIHRQGFGRVCPALPPQSRRASAVEFQPILRKVFQIALESEISVVLRLRHQVAGSLGAVRIIEGRFVDIPRQHAMGAVFDSQDDRMMLLSAVSAEERCVEPRFLVVRIEALSIESDTAFA